MKIGYARVSSFEQNLDRQIAALRAEGVEKIYRDKASGKSLKGRPDLEKAIDALGTDDELIIAEWDRATRSMNDGLNIIARIADRGATIKALDKPWLDLTNVMGKGILALLSAMAEDDRNRIIERAAQGRREAKKKGVKFGRKPILTPHQKKLAIVRKKKGEAHSSIAKDYNVSKSTITRL